jgi:transcriptional regulator with XRE-family HTH domain
MRLERATFGPVLRAARERRGISLHDLADVTKVSVDLWKGLEDNDFSRWPPRIYARTYVREYAQRVGLDPETVVNEFCRLFPEHGDRRVEGLLRAHAEIVQHQLDWRDEPLSPEQRNRRAADRAAAAGTGWMATHAGRFLAIAIDLGLSLGISLLGLLVHFGFWPSLAVSAVAYHAAGVFVSGRTIGMIVSDWAMKTLRLRPIGRRLLSTRAETS